MVFKLPSKMKQRTTTAQIPFSLEEAPFSDSPKPNPTQDKKNVKTKSLGKLVNRMVLNQFVKKSFKKKQDDLSEPSELCVIKETEEMGIASACDREPRSLIGRMLSFPLKIENGICSNGTTTFTQGNFAIRQSQSDVFTTSTNNETFSTESESLGRPIERSMTDLHAYDSERAEDFARKKTPERSTTFIDSPRDVISFGIEYGLEEYSSIEGCYANKLNDLESNTTAIHSNDNSDVNSVKKPEQLLVKSEGFNESNVSLSSESTTRNRYDCASSSKSPESSEYTGSEDDELEPSISNSHQPPSLKDRKHHQSREFSENTGYEDENEMLSFISEPASTLFVETSHNSSYRSFSYDTGSGSSFVTESEYEFY